MIFRLQIRAAALRLALASLILAAPSGFTDPLFAPGEADQMLRELLTKGSPSSPADHTYVAPQTPVENEFSVDKMCPSDGPKAITSLRSLVALNRWDTSFFLWLKEQKLDDAILDYDKEGFGTYDYVRFSKLKTDFLVYLFAQQPELMDLPIQVFQAHRLLDRVRYEGLAGRMPTSFSNAESSESIAMPMEMTFAACAYARNALMASLSESPLMVAKDWHEMDLMIRDLISRDRAYATLRDAVAKIGDYYWDALPSGFLPFYKQLYDWHRFLNKVRNSIPDAPTENSAPLSAVYNPQLARWHQLFARIDSWIPKSSKTPSPTGTESFKEFLAEEIRQTEELLSISPFTDDAERIVALAKASVAEEEKAQEAAWYERLGDGFSKYAFLRDKRVSDISSAFLKEYAVDFAEAGKPKGFERPKDQRRMELTYKNKIYGLTLGAFRAFHHPQALPPTLEMASYDPNKFPLWVQGILAKEAPAENERSDVTEWIYPKEAALHVIFDNMASYSESDLQYLTAWCGRQLFATSRALKLFTPGSIAATTGRKFLDSYQIIYAQAAAYMEGRAQFGTKALEYQLPDHKNIPKVAANAENEMRRHDWSYFFPRAYWWVTDHPVQTLVFVGSLFALPAVAALSSTVLLFRVAILTARAAVYLMRPAIFFAIELANSAFEASRLYLGKTDPQNRFGVSGIQAGQAWIRMGEHLSIVLSFPAYYGGKLALEKAGIKELWALAKELGPHYRELGLRPGASFDRVKAAFKTAAVKNHPDKTRDLAPELAEVMTAKFIRATDAYNAIRVATEKYPRLNNGEWLRTLVSVLQRRFALTWRSSATTQKSGQKAPVFSLPEFSPIPTAEPAMAY